VILSPAKIKFAFEINLNLTLIETYFINKNKYFSSDIGRLLREMTRKEWNDQKFDGRPYSLEAGNSTPWPIPVKEEEKIMLQ
jgi:hypothetical protein